MPGRSGVRCAAPPAPWVISALGERFEFVRITDEQAIVIRGHLLDYCSSEPTPVPGSMAPGSMAPGSKAPSSSADGTSGIPSPGDSASLGSVIVNVVRPGWLVTLTVP